MIRIPFTKAQGAGNDFLILEAGASVSPSLPEWPQWVNRLCDRRFGVGADGVLVLTIPSQAAGADADLRVFNRDGSEAEISGNGTRCAAAYLVETGRCGSQASFHTAAGLKPLTLISRRENLFVFEMAMGKPVLSAPAIPFAPGASVPEPIAAFPLRLPSGTVPVTVTSMGNPHCSISVDHFDWDWKALGAEIETHSSFPRRTNVEFYRVLSRHEIEVRYWERGVGATLSSGTGSCAAAVAAILNQQAESPVTVKTAAGDLPVRWEGEGVFLTGPAEILCRGEFWGREEAPGVPARIPNQSRDR